MGSSTYHLFRGHFSRKGFLLLLCNLVAQAHGITSVEIQNTQCSACRGLVIAYQVSPEERLSYLKNLRSVGKLRLFQQELILFVVYFYAVSWKKLWNYFSDQSYSSITNALALRWNWGSTGRHTSRRYWAEEKDSFIDNSQAVNVWNYTRRNSASSIPCLPDYLNSAVHVSCVCLLPCLQHCINPPMWNSLEKDMAKIHKQFELHSWCVKERTMFKDQYKGLRSICHSRPSAILVQYITILS